MHVLSQNLTIILYIALSLIISGCNLNINQSDTTQQILIPTTTQSGDTVLDDGDGRSTATPDTDNLSTRDNIIQATPCASLEGWTFAYEVQRGDTLTGIANLIASDTTTLAEGNCLDNPNALRVGQTLMLPIDPNRAGDGFADASIGNPWFVIGNNNTDLPVSCDSFAYEVSNGIPTSSDVGINLEQALQTMLAQPRTISLNNENLTNYWGEQDLTVALITMTNARVDITLNGQAMLFGSCADGAMEAQMLLTVFDNDAISEAQIIIGGRNMAQLFDMSGQTQADAIYTRDDIPFRR